MGAEYQSVLAEHRRLLREAVTAQDRLCLLTEHDEVLGVAAPQLLGLA